MKVTPTWSPDGRRLAFVWHSGEHRDLYVMSAKGGRKRRLAKDASWISGLSWQAVRRPSARRRR